MSEANLFWITVFLITDISVFSKDKFCWFSLKAFGVNSVRVSMCAKMSSANGGGQRQWPNDHVNGKQNVPIWPWRREGLVTFPTMGHLGRVCGDVVCFLCLLPDRRNATSLTPSDPRATPTVPGCFPWSFAETWQYTQWECILSS